MDGWFLNFEDEHLKICLLCYFPRGEGKTSREDLSYWFIGWNIDSCWYNLMFYLGKSLFEGRRELWNILRSPRICFACSQKSIGVRMRSLWNNIGERYTVTYKKSPIFIIYHIYYSTEPLQKWQMLIRGTSMKSKNQQRLFV